MIFTDKYGIERLTGLSVLSGIFLWLQENARNQLQTFVYYYNYWIYNLIRAFFFRNLNVYLRKTCTIVLFKVFPIWSYDCFPSFWKFVDSIPKELRRLGGQEWIKPIFETLFSCEPYSSEGVLHRPEQMIVRRGKVWAIRRVG